MQLNNLKKHILQTYALLRIGNALIGLLFPLVLWWGGLVRQVPFQESISAYYHTPMGDIFVGSLCAIGAFLYFYKGVTEAENIALNIAGIFIVLVALLPTAAPLNLECPVFTAPTWHGLCAVLFFVAIAYVCWFRASDTLKELKNPPREKMYRRLYKILGIGMIALPLMVVLLYKLQAFTGLIFFIELVAIWIFSIYWILKTLEIRESQIDRKAFTA